jgi:hypothetical protein
MIRYVAEIKPAYMAGVHDQREVGTAYVIELGRAMLLEGSIPVPSRSTLGNEG